MNKSYLIKEMSGIWCGSSFAKIADHCNYFMATAFVYHWLRLKMMLVGIYMNRAPIVS